MKCPYCQHLDTKVIDSRDVESGIRRRRECLACESRFTTYERIEAQSLYVIKKDNRREEFDRNKLVAGVRMACTKRPLPIGSVERVVTDVENELHRLGRSEIASSVIGELVMERLKALDHIAYVRFASVYREFTDIDSLRQELESLASGDERRDAPVNQLRLLPDDVVTLPRGRRGRRLISN